MFTGIIEAKGTIAAFKQLTTDWQLIVNVGKLDMSDVSLGDSIAVNGCCLTVVAMTGTSFTADVSNESIHCTTFSDLKSGAPVNLEKAMLASGRLGGHMVSGHVDGVGKIVSMIADGLSQVITVEVPAELAHYIAGKGSICIDGTSLTVNTVEGNQFSINVIPHTQQETIIGNYKPGTSVNLEVDLVARYLERLIGIDNEGESSEKASKIDTRFLAKHGFR